MKQPPMLSLTVPPALDGETVSTLLRRGLGCSGSLVKQIKHLPNGLMLDGVSVTVAHRAQAGQRLRAQLPPDPPSEILPVSHPLELPFEDDYLLVVNKLPLVPVHPGPDHHGDTLGNFLTAHYEAEGEAHLFRPVNRLDRGTSGLLVVAKHSYIQEALKHQLHSAAFRRVYLAICEGCPHPPVGTVSAPIGRLEGSVLRRTVRPDGAPAVTHYATLATTPGRALLRLELETGRTHQIRVHMAHIGHPLVGDFLYGTEEPDLIPRAALHAAALSFRHPVTGATLSFSAPLPEDMRSLWPDAYPLYEQAVNLTNETILSPNDL